MAVNATHITFSNKLVDALTNLGQSVLHKQVVVQKVEKETIRGHNPITGIRSQTGQFERHVLYSNNKGWDENIITSGLNTSIEDEFGDFFRSEVTEIKLFTFGPYSSLPLHMDRNRSYAINFPIHITKQSQLLMHNIKTSDAEYQLYETCKADGSWDKKRNAIEDKVIKELTEFKINGCHMINTRSWHTVLNLSQESRSQLSIDCSNISYDAMCDKLKYYGWIK